ncbi:MAG: hypothetical protein LBL06_04915 [Treponema sp.]|nr:hypothetical protein [Treponema sp.]
MKKYHSFGKSAMTALFVTIFIEATLRLCRGLGRGRAGSARHRGNPPTN